MSDATPGDLQFDQAEFKEEAAPLACFSCSQPIRAAYYQVGEAITCDLCRRKIEWDASHGSSIGRFAKASLLGFLGAALGAGLYYGVRAATGYEFGLIAVVVGLFVGGAVRLGSGHRGGIPYQLLAMFLTYASIVSTYVPDIWKGLKQAESEQAAEGAQGNAAARPAEASAVTAVPASGTPATATSGAIEPATAFSLPLLVLALLGFTAIVFAAPFLMGLENVIGIVIIGIGLYEAWKMNRKPDRTVTGPFQIKEPIAPLPGTP